jgi:curved DNA-binding protein CbpA
MSKDTLWSMDAQKIQHLTGSLSQYDMIGLLLLTVGHSVTVQWRFQTISIRFDAGVCTGFKGPIVDSLGVHNLEEGLMFLMSQGKGYEEVLQEMFEKLLESLLRLPPETTFRVETDDLGRSIPLNGKVGTIITKLLYTSQTDDALLRRYGRLMSARLDWSVLPFEVTKLRLPLSLTKEYRKLKSSQIVKEALDVENRVTERWKAFDILVRMKFVSLSGEQTSTQPSSQTLDEPVNADRLKELSSYLDEIIEQLPYKTFGLTAPNEVTDQEIGKRFRELSMEYHPDRHRGASSLEREIIVDIYAQLNEVYATLQDEEYRVTLKNRLDVERRGLQYVSPENEKKSELLHAKGTFYTRKRKYTEALDVLQEAFDMNPYNWRINTLLARCEAELGQKTKKEVAELLADNKEARGSDRVEILYQAAIYFLQDGVVERAYELFGKVVEMDPGHIDAKRHLHLKKKSSNSEPQEAKESSSFFSRLFGKK